MTFLFVLACGFALRVSDTLDNAREDFREMEAKLRGLYAACEVIMPLVEDQRTEIRKRDLRPLEEKWKKGGGSPNDPYYLERVEREIREVRDGMGPLDDAIYLVNRQLDATEEIIKSLDRGDPLKLPAKTEAA